MGSAMLGVVVSCLLVSLVSAACDRDIDMNGEILFEDLTHHSNAVVYGIVLSIGNDGVAEVQLNCIYKTDGSRQNKMIQVSPAPENCPNAILHVGAEYVFFLEKTSTGYVPRYTPFSSEAVNEVATLCEVQLTVFGDADVCAPLETDGCISYEEPTTARPHATAEPTPKTPSGIVVKAQEEATPEPTGGAATSFLSCAVSCLSFITALVLL